TQFDSEPVTLLLVREIKPNIGTHRLNYWEVWAVFGEKDQAPLMNPFLRFTHKRKGRFPCRCSRVGVKGPPTCLRAAESTYKKTHTNFCPADLSSHDSSVTHQLYSLRKFSNFCEPRFSITELRESLELTKQYEKSDKDLKPLQSVGQIVGELLQQSTEEQLIVKATNGPRYAIGCHRQLDRIASQLNCNFLKVVTISIIDKYLGESACLIREMFNYARDHQPCVFLMDETDAIGGHWLSDDTSADSEIQRTLMDLLNQKDGFDILHRVKMIMTPN
ncbi:hypothetical protein U0070_006560, partial [Myodes glareolus]